MDGIASDLAAVRLFADVEADVLEGLARHAFVRRRARGQARVTAGEPTAHRSGARSGRLRVLGGSPRGEELVLSVLGPSSALGELSVLDRQFRSASAEAVEATELVAVPAAEVRTVLLENPAALLAVAVVAALLANVVNNLPATLALIPLTLASPLAGLAVLLGVNIGPTWCSSTCRVGWPSSC